MEPRDISEEPGAPFILKSTGKGVGSKGKKALLDAGADYQSSSGPGRKQRRHGDLPDTGRFTETSASSRTLPLLGAGSASPASPSTAPKAAVTPGTPPRFHEQVQHLGEGSWALRSRAERANGCLRTRMLVIALRFHGRGGGKQMGKRWVLWCGELTPGTPKQAAWGRPAGSEVRSTILVVVLATEEKR